MSLYFYSASINMFYPAVKRGDYENAGSWPDDAVEVEDSVYQEFAADMAPAGKVRIPDGSGMPAWGDIPPPTPEQILTANTVKFKVLLRTATDTAFPLQSALTLGIITPEQQSMLTALQQYSVQLTETDLTQNPIIWPIQPIHGKKLA